MFCPIVAVIPALACAIWGLVGAAKGWPLPLLSPNLLLLPKRSLQGWPARVGHLLCAALNIAALFVLFWVIKFMIENPE
jgi:hypothetical protein